MLDLFRRKVRALFGGQNPGVELGGSDNGPGAVHKRHRIHDIRYKVRVLCLLAKYIF